jgi:hypothetical protein
VFRDEATLAHRLNVPAAPYLGTLANLLILREPRRLHGKAVWRRPESWRRTSLDDDDLSGAPHVVFWGVRSWQFGRIATGTALAGNIHAACNV